MLVMSDIRPSISGNFNNIGTDRDLDLGASLKGGGVSDSRWLNALRNLLLNEFIIVKQLFALTEFFLKNTCFLLRLPKASATNYGISPTLGLAADLVAAL